MKTVSNYLFELYKPHLHQLVGVKNSDFVVFLNEIPLLSVDGMTSTVQDRPEVTVSATLVSDKTWRGVCIPEIGSLSLESSTTLYKEGYFKNLDIVLRLGKGKETQDILDILKESLK